MNEGKGRGGKREGSGRKRIGSKQRNIWLTDEQYEKVKAFVQVLKYNKD